MSNCKHKILQFGKYTWSEITAMVADGYIPIANATELDGIRNTTPKTMGVGSIWEDEYVTGLDKKYVQINNIDLSGFANWNSIETFIGLYDGNELFIKNLTINKPTTDYTGLFGRYRDVQLYNMRFINARITGRDRFGTVIGQQSTAGGSNIFDNILIFNSIINGRNIVSGFGYVLDGQISNCHIFDGEITGNNMIGGLLNIARNITGGTLTTANKCSSNAGFVRNTDGYIGGFAGISNRDSGITNCYSTTAVYANGIINSDYGAGGFIGYMLSNSTHLNNFSTGLVVRESGTIRIGGYAPIISSGTITNCYYDKDTSGRSDTGKGLPRSTQQMKEGTADSTIGGEAMYTNWDDTIWNFRTINKYPKIKKL